MAKVKVKVKEPQHLLDDWTALNDYLRTADEGSCKQLMDLEQAGKNRTTIVARIYARWSRMRRKRERLEIMG